MWEEAVLQVEGFQKALSKGGTAAGFLGFLSKKKGKAGVSADSITLDDMLTYSQVILCFFFPNTFQACASVRS